MQLKVEQWYDIFIIQLHRYFNCTNKPWQITFKSPTFISCNTMYTYLPWECNAKYIFYLYAYITDSKGHVRLSPIEYSCTCTQWGQNQTNLTLKTINIDIICFDLTNGCICLESCPFRQFSTFLSMLARGLVEIYILWSLFDKIFH